MSITLCSNSGFKASANLLHDDEDYFVLNTDESHIVLEALYNVSAAFLNTLDKRGSIPGMERSETIETVHNFHTIYESVSTFLADSGIDVELPPFPDVPEF